MQDVTLQNNATACILLQVIMHSIREGVILVTDSLLSVKDVAEWLKVSERTVFNLIDRKEITGAKVGNRWRFEPEEIRAYLTRQQQIPQQGSAA